SSWTTSPQAKRAERRQYVATASGDAIRGCLSRKQNFGELPSLRSWEVVRSEVELEADLTETAKEGATVSGGSFSRGQHRHHLSVGTRSVAQGDVVSAMVPPAAARIGTKERLEKNAQ